MKSVTKQLKDLQDLSKGTHSLESLLKLAGLKEDQAQITYDKSMDGLPKRFEEEHD